ncbi:MAG: Protein containing transglutaminase-like domain, putative cysteine protease [Polyangiaceae bacterium]|nr:Protein containing transglutaminase-like domain, putative cysteine protease [Polyangiaceae bacterium]
MSRLAIRHRTTYRYTLPVSFAPHVVRLTPRADVARCLSRTLLVTPTPVSLADEVDELGNAFTRLAFGPDLTTELVVESHLLVETAPPPSLEVAPPLPPLPWTAPHADALARFRSTEADSSVASLAQSLSNEVGGAPLPFFDRLCRYLHDHIERGLRLEGDAQTPSQTLATRSGACRDLTVLYLAVCRALGVAGRFVSGYQGEEATPDGQRHLHAWPELFVPQLGWLGWDPTHGVRTGRGHVALCVAANQDGTMPIEGGYYFSGSTITSTLDYSITVEPA